MASLLSLVIVVVVLAAIVDIIEQFALDCTALIAFVTAWMPENHRRAQRQELTQVSGFEGHTLDDLSLM